MSNFEQAVKTVFENEGGLTDHPADPGGITNYGITLNVLREDGVFGDIDGDGDIDADDIRTLTIDQARAIYDRQWWERYGYGRIDNQWIATKLLDLSVNMGPRQAHIIAQRALLATGYPVKEDGILGAVTIEAINNCANKSGLHIAMRSEAAGVYRLIVARKPALSVFLTGWLRRAYQ